MTQKLSIILFIVISFNSINIFAQNKAEKDTVFITSALKRIDDSIVYKTDTVLFSSAVNRHILIGTTVLPETYGQQIARGYGYFLTKFEKSHCEDAGESSPVKYISDIIKTDTLVVFELTVTENCCHSFLADLAVVGSTLNLRYYGYGTYCSCTCIVRLKYFFKIEKFKNFSKIKNVMINGNQKTEIPLKY